MLRALNCPNQENLAGSNCALSESSNEIPNIWYLVCDANTTGEENEAAIRIEGVFRAVGAFDETGRLELSTGGRSSLLVKLVGETCSGTDDEGDPHLLHCGEILAVRGELVPVDVVGTIHPRN